MRPSTVLLGLLAGLLAAGGAAGLHARAAQRAGRAGLEEQAQLVHHLGLTDLCLFTEARYTRHPSQADRFAPFQDHPHALEHFPSGSLAAPPR
jgi:hypothetical protein